MPPNWEAIVVLPDSQNLAHGGDRVGLGQTSWLLHLRGGRVAAKADTVATSHLGPREGRSGRLIYIGHVFAYSQGCPKSRAATASADQVVLRGGMKPVDSTCWIPSNHTWATILLCRTVVRILVTLGQAVKTPSMYYPRQSPL